MEEEWRLFLKDSAPELYEQMIGSISWAAEWRDKKISEITAELGQRKKAHLELCIEHEELKKEVEKLNSPVIKSEWQELQAEVERVNQLHESVLEQYNELQEQNQRLRDVVVETARIRRASYYCCGFDTNMVESAIRKANEVLEGGE